MPLPAVHASMGKRDASRHIAGRPLFTWSLEQAITSKCFDETCVITDSPEIRRKISDEFAGMVTVLDPAAAGCVDTSMENILPEFQQQVDFDVACVIQAAFPLTRAADFSAAKQIFLAGNLDSLVTVVRSKRLIWTMAGKSVSCEGAYPNQQGFEEHLLENGAFYLARSKLLTDHRCRTGGRIGFHEMAAETVIEINEGAERIVEEQLLSRQRLTAVGAGASRIRALVVDVDGTLTDGGMYYGPAGEALKKFNTRDAHGLQLLREHGIKVCVISAENSPAVEARMRKLNIDEYHPGIENKFTLLSELARSWNIDLHDIAYMGDDLSDLECLRRAGTAFCPADSVPEILQEAHYVCKRQGGNGAVREACDLILKVNRELLPIPLHAEPCSANE